jgi:flavin reductase (NADH)
VTVYQEDLLAGLKNGMRRLAASVCILSLQDQQGRRLAMTATAVTSLSDNPPALLVCVNKSASSSQPLQQGCAFCINVLDKSQEALSVLCASKPEEKRFSQGNWQDHHQKHIPYLADAQASFFCINEKIVEYGSHLIVIGRLDEVRTSDTPINPLLYIDGTYRQLP